MYVCVYVCIVCVHIYTYTYAYMHILCVCVCVCVVCVCVCVRARARVVYSYTHTHERAHPPARDMFNVCVFVRVCVQSPEDIAIAHEQEIMSALLRCWRSGAMQEWEVVSGKRSLSLPPSPSSDAVIHTRVRTVAHASQLQLLPPSPPASSLYEQ